MKLKIKETIVVEGKRDVANLERVCSANFIITGGIQISSSTMVEIERAMEDTGIIVFTDPDGPGEAIRRRISERFPSGIKHAYISKREGRKNGDIGVENASESALISALESLKLVGSAPQSDAIGYTFEDLFDMGLAGGVGSKDLRHKLCARLRIGECNSKTFLKKIRSYGISRDKIEAELKDLKGE